MKSIQHYRSRNDFNFYAFFGMAVHAQSEEEHPAPDTTELAKQTQNPVADLISLPFQFNFNNGGGLNGRSCSWAGNPVIHLN